MLHGYSAKNAGDGLLVDETLAVVRTAFGDAVEITIAASHPETFAGIDARVVDSSPSATGYAAPYRRLLRELDDADLVVAVGGGYLRAGYAVETLKTALVHGPQLWAASRTSTPTVYLPQSVGPAGAAVGRALTSRMRKIDAFYVRDDRSLAEFADAGVRRLSDLAILGADHIERRGLDVDSVPVLTVRAVRGKLGPLVVDLAHQLGTFDGYVQSATAGNNDVDAMASVGARKILPRSEFMTPGAPRVVVAVRLHAALMALKAGHYVVHLAYERKGFGAFADLGLDRYVHNVNKFEPARVLQQVRTLLDDESERARYAADVDAALQRAAPAREQLIEELRRLVPTAERTP
ncbi:Polysaccharide pyruvyl transferase family protein WcaK [Rhodococcoides kyotonense]|uniref:Polysaccharide pyruvyl transferase family protein WcaK n=1 Tax=Rhodococcoides kyotonense TaxID=398843 RepID=A0A239LKJ7_9NOCA|nr:Polysaccharide pyruvyl transferase family protein WcaK [Rhodococcus kyotonensis]